MWSIVVMFQVQVGKVFYKAIGENWIMGRKESNIG